MQRVHFFHHPSEWVRGTARIMSFNNSIFSGMISRLEIAIIRGDKLEPTTDVHRSWHVIKIPFHDCLYYVSGKFCITNIIYLSALDVFVLFSTWTDLSTQNLFNKHVSWRLHFFQLSRKIWELGGRIDYPYIQGEQILGRSPKPLLFYSSNTGQHQEGNNSFVISIFLIKHAQDFNLKCASHIESHRTQPPSLDFEFYLITERSQPPIKWNYICLFPLASF